MVVTKVHKNQYINTPFPIRFIIEMVKMKRKDVENMLLMWL